MASSIYQFDTFKLTHPVRGAEQYVVSECQYHIIVVRALRDKDGIIKVFSDITYIHDNIVFSLLFSVCSSSAFCLNHITPSWYCLPFENYEIMVSYELCSVGSLGNIFGTVDATAIIEVLGEKGNWGWGSP